jgi:hypothetical protein
MKVVGGNRGTSRKLKNSSKSLAADERRSTQIENAVLIGVHRRLNMPFQ